MSDADTPDPAAEKPAAPGAETAAPPADSLDTVAAAVTEAARASGADSGDKSTKQGRGGAFLGVPIEVTISVGKARPLVSELIELRRDSVLPLDSTVEDPVELYVGDKLIARGELQELGEGGGRLGVRLTEVADISSEL